MRTAQATCVVPKVERLYFCALCGDDGYPCPSCDNGRTTEALAARAVTLLCLAGGDLDVLTGSKLSALAAALHWRLDAETVRAAA